VANKRQYIVEVTSADREQGTNCDYFPIQHWHLFSARYGWILIHSLNDFQPWCRSFYETKSLQYLCHEKKKQKVLLGEGWNSTANGHSPRTFYGSIKIPEWVNGIDLKGKAVLPSRPDLPSSSRTEHNFQISAHTLSCFPQQRTLGQSNSHHATFFTFERFTLPPAHFYHKDERVLSENLQIRKCLSPPATTQFITLPSPFFLVALPILPSPTVPVTSSYCTLADASLGTQIRHN
jgi:hypothetical protein